MESRQPRRIGREALWSYALRILAGRSLAIADLRERLARRAADASDVEPILARLKDYGYLDDRRYAESYASARKENQALGKFRVLRDLRQRRVAPAVAQKAVEQVYKGSDEEALIEAFLRRKFRSKPLRELLGESKNLLSAYRKLRRAGFTSGSSIRVLKRFSQEADQLEGVEEAEEG